MRNLLMWAAAALMAAACLAADVHAQSAPPERLLTVDDLLGLEAFGRVDISPDGRWAIYEKRAGYDAMPRVEANGRSTWAIMTLWLADLEAPASTPQALLPEEGPGLQFLAWSPSGESLVITRLRGDAFEYGIVTLSDRSVRWTGQTPDLPPNGAPAVWTGEDAVILAVRPDHSLPLLLGYDRTSTRRRAAAWERTALGVEPSRTVIEADAGILTTETAEPMQRLVSLNPRTGGTRLLAEGRIADFAVSPDGAAVALVTREEQMPLAQPELLHMEADRRHRITVIDLKTGRTTPAPAGLDIAPHLLRWSPDSDALLLWARRDGEPWSDGELVQITASGINVFERGGLEVGGSADVVLSGVRADWIGRSPVLYARRPSGDRPDWYLVSTAAPPRPLTSALAAAPVRIAGAGPEALYAFADGAYWRLTPAGAQRAGPAEPPLREAVLFDLNMGRRLKNNEAPRRAWSPAVAADGESLSVADGAVTILGGRGGRDERLMAASRDAAVVIRRTGLVETLVLKTRDDEHDLDAVNTGLAGVGLTEPTPIRHPALEGGETTSWLFLPRGGAADIRGVIVKVYPGWADNLVRVDPLTMTYSSRPEVFVAAGYAVLSPSIPGDLPPGERGEGYARSAELAVDAALAAFPQLPADRLTLWGHSFGGYAALEIATRSSRYRSYIASSAYSDMAGVWGEFDAMGRIQPENGMFFRFNQGWTEVGQGGLGAPPWAAPDLYEASSPVWRADRITRPVLLLTADLDFTPMSQAERMFSAILRNGGKARMVTYWGEKHLIWSPANIRDYYGQIFSWLSDTLSASGDLPGPEPTAPPSGASIPPPPPPSE